MNGSLNLPRQIGSMAAAIAASLVIAHQPASSQTSWGNNDQYVTATSSSWGSGWGNQNWYGASGTTKQWMLGVNGTNDATGVVVRQVSPNSPASRAGIRPSDIIVSVSSDRVGIVDGKVFELRDELNHHADSSGNVELLVQESRSLRLKPMRIQLSDQQSGLSGTIVVEGGTLPPDSMVSVQLENVTRPHYVIRNGQYTFRVPSYGSARIPFTLNYDPNYIFATDTYRVRAYVTSGGRTIFDTLRPPFVLTQGNPSNVELRVSPVSNVATTNGTGSNSGSVFSAGYANYDLISQRVTEAYQRYLERQPSAMELAAWHQVPDTDYRLSRLPMELMASQEYYDRCGNNNLVWVRKVFGEMIGRTPSALEMDQWMRRFAELNYSRTSLMQQMDSIRNN